MKRDINNRTDIRKLIYAFYEKLLEDEEFKYIFFEVAQFDILKHANVMIDFWDSTIFQTGRYKNDVVAAHLNLNRVYKYELKNKHFEDWLRIFNTTIDELFEGKKAKGLKERALTIATIMKIKIADLNQKRLELNN